MTEKSSLSDKSKKIIESASIAGQKQLMQFGESILLKKQIEANRKEKEELIDDYISKNFEIKLPKGLKDDNYNNAIRNLIEANKEDLLKRYEKEVQLFGNELLKTVQSKNDIVIKDFINIYYGYRLLKSRLKKVSEQLVKEKKATLDLQDLYNEDSAAGIEMEDKIENLEYNIHTFKLLIYFLIFVNIFSTVVLGTYLFLGPNALYNDTIYIANCIYSLGVTILSFFDKLFNYIFHLPNSIKFLFLLKGAVSYYLLKNKKDELIALQSNYSKNILKNIRDVIGNLRIKYFKKKE